jgi:hypothetical protein
MLKSAKVYATKHERPKANMMGGDVGGYDLGRSWLAGIAFAP